MRTRVAFVLSFAAAAILAAQAPQDRTQPPTFRGGANYVRVDMYATIDGRPVSDLRPEELEVLEDGAPQKVEDFEHVVVRPAGVNAERKEVDGLRESREAAGDPRARVFVIFLDTYHTQADGSAMMRQPLARFLDRVLGPDDLVALMTPEMAGSDIALGRKTGVIADIVSNEWWGRRARVAGQDEKEKLYEQCVGSSQLDRQTRDSVLKEMIDRRRERLTLDALDDLMTHLAGLRDERKAVVLVTEGWMLFEPNRKLAEIAASKDGPVPVQIFKPPVKPPSESGPFTRDGLMECEADVHTLAAFDGDRRLRDITDEANRGNVTFYPVYARGLAVFDAPIGPDYPPSPAQDAANLRTRQDSMRTIAAETDGEAIINTNNTEGGLRRIADDLSSYYLFGYYSTNTKLDGRFRSITVRVKRPGVRVRARRGYRARTAEQVGALATRTESVSTSVMNALNSVVGVNSRSTFRVRPAAWTRLQNGTPVGTVWVVGELDFRTRREPAWANGARGDVMLLAANGDQLESAQVEIPAGQGAFTVRMLANAPIPPGDYAVRVRLRAGAGAETSDTARLTMPPRPSPVSEAVMWRRGPSTGTQYVRTAVPQFQRNERLRLELAADASGSAARLLDRAGKATQVPVQIGERTDADGVRWIVADVILAPLAAGDYVVEVTAGDATQATGFRIVP